MFAFDCIYEDEPGFAFVGDDGRAIAPPEPDDEHLDRVLFYCPAGLYHPDLNLARKLPDHGRR